MTKPLSSEEVGKQLAEKTMRELGWDPKTGKPMKVGEDRKTNPSPSPNSSYPSPTPSYSSPNPSYAPSYHLHVPKTPFRIRGIEKTTYQSPSGTTYRYSALYRNAIVLQLLIEKFADGLDAHRFMRYIKQVTDAARSTVANIAEGYARPTTKEYLDYLGFAKASLEEVQTDIVHAKDIGQLPSQQGSSVAGLGIILQQGAELGEIKRRIGAIRREDLTYEIYIELLNKTSYLFKRTIEGLWEKLSKDEQEKLKEELDTIRSRYW